MNWLRHELRLCRMNCAFGTLCIRCMLQKMKGLIIMLYVVRIGGLISVIGICISIGNLIAKGYSNRVRNILDFITVLNIMHTKIRYNQEVLENIFIDVQKEITRDVGRIFYEVGIRYNDRTDDISKIWTDVIEEHFKDLDLVFEDERILIDFGLALGKSDIEGELRNIEVTIEKLKSQLTYAKDLRDKYAKVYQTLGTLSGIAIAVILI